MLQILARFISSLISSFFSLIAPERENYRLTRTLSPEKLETLPKATIRDEHLSWITALYTYRTPEIKAFIWQLKYHNEYDKLPLFAAHLFEAIVAYMSDVLLFDADARFILIPIPMTATRRATRGYNQCEYICREIITLDTHHFLTYAPQYLSKMKETEEQNKTRTRGEREAHMHGVFSADPRAAGYYVILIDDVVTTGATLSDAKRALEAVGARAVVAFTLAH